MATTPSIARRIPWRLQVLGPLELRRDGRPVALRRQVRVLLAWLAAHREGISISRLVELTWGDAAPSGAPRQVVDHLRIGADGPVILADGRARLDRTAIDVDEDHFVQLVGGAAGRAELEAALGLWRGAPFDELDHHPDVVAHVRRLEDRYDRALARLYAIRLLDPELSRAVADLTTDTLRHPTSARLGRLLAAGLAMTGRRVEALRAARAAAALDPDARTWVSRLESATQADDLDALQGLVAELGG